MQNWTHQFNASAKVREPSESDSNMYLTVGFYKRK